MIKYIYLYLSKLLFRLFSGMINPNILNMKTTFKLFLLSFLISLSGCVNSQIEIKVAGCEESTVMAFAKEELEKYMLHALEREGVKGKYIFEFVCDKSLVNGEFSCEALSSLEFRLKGADPMAVSHAVYTFLEELGYTFDIYRTVIPERFDFDRIGTLHKEVVPAVRYRGIRQHVNFPMDISSYPIEEAKEYINNLVRLRFNKLVVHSYPGMWHEQPQGDSTLYAGNFFYDSPHNFADNVTLKSNVRFNDSIFCIPVMEHIYFSQPEKSRKAIGWMSELLDYAKSIGLYVQFSFEPRTFTSEQTVFLLKDIQRTYPMVDAIEIMTEETGGWGASATREEVEATLKQYFGEEILKDPVIAGTISDRQVDLNYLYAQIGRNSQAIKELLQEAQFQNRDTELKLGIYCSTGYSVASHHLARKTLPDTKIVIMPSHGSDGVFKAAEKILTNAEEVNMTEVYSWIEFDGLMYQQQNAITGIHNLIGYLKGMSAGNQIPSLCFNHWRTCDNSITARYAAVATLADVKPNDFYHFYAERLNIPSGDTFAKIMEKIDDIDSFSTTSLGNIGFCWTGAWRNDGLFKWMNVNNIDIAISAYSEISDILSGLIAETSSPEALRVLGLLENRCLSSVIYMEAFKMAADLRKIPSGELTEKDKQNVIAVCNNALGAFERYMAKYAELLPDRGAEGTIVSIWNSPMQGLRLVRQRLAGVPLEYNYHKDNPIDSPPLPIYFE